MSPLAEFAERMQPLIEKFTDHLSAVTRTIRRCLMRLRAALARSARKGSPLAKWALRAMGNVGLPANLRHAPVYEPGTWGYDVFGDPPADWVRELPLAERVAIEETLIEIERRAGRPLPVPQRFT